MNIRVGLSTLNICTVLYVRTREHCLIDLGIFFQNKDFRGFLYLSSISPAQRPVCVLMGYRITGACIARARTAVKTHYSRIFDNCINIFVSTFKY
jgi:hypothetical protein